MPPPKTLAGFPEAKPAKRKTSVHGGGGLRKRWRDDGGRIYEWDSRHGTIEIYDSTGRHLGEFNANTGEQLKDAEAGRIIEP
ncbi:MAG TPA: colicin E3/pyocin S6 family cytotoxin [Pyrinomonadaceae bacterium]|nr:colicin E3/pyocin S6 family cytotoxin [Pyrinomonadaceae bacterium]